MKEFYWHVCIGFNKITQRVERNIATIMRCWRSWSKESRHNCRRRLLIFRNRHVTSRLIGIIFWERLTIESQCVRTSPNSFFSYRPRLIRIFIANCDEEWNKIVFSDESRFFLWIRDGQRKEFLGIWESVIIRGMVIWNEISWADTLSKLWSPLP